MIRALIRHFFNLFRKFSEQEKNLNTSIKSMIGGNPLNIDLYVLATSHSSVAKTNLGGIKDSNERLEFLGDAILGSVVAEHLFKKFPFKDEGFLTETRSKIVNRESLNLLAKKIGINSIISYENNRNTRSHKSIYGNTLEALVGAVYLDRGHSFCSNFIIRKLLVPHFDLDELIETDSNFKSKVIEWAQKEGKPLSFDIKNIISKGNYKEFTAHVIIEEEVVGEGHGSSKKRAEQAAASKACQKLAL
ncbi:MAG: ribonuclease III [Cyclobacteriaceae bacterium]|nr:ribonuclease III [Cyclobacteriaceae bacterium]